MAGIGKAVVGIWGRGRRSAGVTGTQGGLLGGRGAGAGPTETERGGEWRRWQSRDQARGRGQGGEPGRATHWCHRALPPSRWGRSSGRRPPRQCTCPRCGTAGRGSRQCLREAGVSRGQDADPPPPPPAHSPRPLTLVAVGACEAAVTDAGEVAAGQADAASMGPTHAGGRHAGHPGSCLQPAAVNHCGKGEGSALAPFLQTPPPPRRPCPHLCRPLQGRGPWAQSSSCRPCSQGRRSSSRPPGCSSGRRSSRGSAHRGQCPPAGWGYREDPAAPGRLARSPRGPRHQACIARA